MLLKQGIGHQLTQEGPIGVQPSTGFWSSEESKEGCASREAIEQNDKFNARQFNCGLMEEH